MAFTNNMEKNGQSYNKNNVCRSSGTESGATGGIDSSATLSNSRTNYSIPKLIIIYLMIHCSTVIAQKSSGVLESSDFQNASPVVANIDDAVTQNAAASSNAKGATLISMRCAGLDAQLEAQRARVKQYSLDHQSDKQMLEGNAVSRFTAEKSKASLDEQRALYKEAQVNQRNCKVIAPFSGGVVSKEAQAYEAVTPSDIIMSIINDNGLVMSLNVPSSYVNKVKPNDKFTVSVDETGKRYAAKVVGVSPAIDPVSKTIELRAAIIEGLDELAPGMSGRANLDFSR